MWQEFIRNLRACAKLAAPALVGMALGCIVIGVLLVCLWAFGLWGMPITVVILFVGSVVLCAAYKTFMTPQREADYLKSKYGVTANE